MILLHWWTVYIQYLDWLVLDESIDTGKAPRSQTFEFCSWQLRRIKFWVAGPLRASVPCFQCRKRTNDVMMMTMLQLRMDPSKSLRDWPLIIECTMFDMWKKKTIFGTFCSLGLNRYSNFTFCSFLEGIVTLHKFSGKNGIEKSWYFQDFSPWIDRPGSAYDLPMICPWSAESHCQNDGGRQHFIFFGNRKKHC